MYEDIIRLLLIKVGKYSEHLSNKDQDAKSCLRFSLSLSLVPDKE